MIHSHSSLSTFEQCPYKFKLKYIEKIDPIIKDTIESFMGKMVHETLEKLYMDLQYDKVISIEDLLHFLNHIWYENYNDQIVIIKKQYTMEKYLSLAKQYISDYYQKYKPFNQTKTIGIENHLIFPLDKQKNYQIQGFIDRLSEKEPRHFQIHDYKTSSRLPSQKQLDSDRQLGLYMLGVKNQYPQVKDITLIWHFLKFNKELQSTRSNQQLEKLKDKVITLIKRIESSKTFTCNLSPLCNWCEYKPICPQHSSLYQISKKRENSYLKQTGQQLVDRYVDSKRK
jgi:putative RecB family exonuclease